MELILNQELEVVTRIREMIEMGSSSKQAQDTICDGFHLYGTGDPLDYG